MNPKPISVTYTDPSAYEGPEPQPFTIVGAEPGGGSGGAVDSVNGKTGAVVLSASDVGAATSAQGALADTAVQPDNPRLPIILTQAEYDLLTPVAGQVYIIQG